LLIIGSACEPSIRPILTAAAISMISVGSMTGPILAGVLTARATWRWCTFSCSKKVQGTDVRPD
jgi:MFS family permease